MSIVLVAAPVPTVVMRNQLCPKPPDPKSCTLNPEPSAGGCRDAQKEAGLAEKKLHRLEASRDIKLAVGLLA